MPLRKPRAWLVIDGQPIPLIHADATVHRYQSADTFTAEFALDAPGVPDEAYWAGRTSIKAELFGTNGDGSGEVSLVKGQIDQVELRFDARSVHVTGRDRTAELLDKTTTEKFQDQKPTDVVKAIAGRHGFTLQVDDTSSKAGEQYVGQHDLLTDGESEWSVVVGMAEREGKVAFVKGDTLYFVAPGTADGGSLQIAYERPTQASFAAGTFISLSCRRNLQPASDTKVKVNSWDRRKKKVVTSTKEMPASGNGSGPTVEFNYTMPGLSQDEADAIADKKLSENTSHEMMIDVSMAGDVNADPRQKAVLSGTNTAFDQDYFIDSISHSFSFSDGYRMTIAAKNKASGRSAK